PDLLRWAGVVFLRRHDDEAIDPARLSARHAARRVRLRHGAPGAALDFGRSGDAVRRAAERPARAPACAREPRRLLRRRYRRGRRLRLQLTTPAGPRSRSAQRLLALLCALVCLLSGDRAARAQVADLELSSSVFHEPSAVSAMTVLAPSARLSVSPWEFLSINAGWEADIVSGATEPIKAGPLSSPDIISQATMDDTRHVLSGGFTITKDNTQLS